MADKAVVTQSTLDAIGQAIINKGGATEAMTPAQMPEKIMSIPTGGGLTGHKLTVRVTDLGGTYDDIHLTVLKADGTFMSWKFSTVDHLGTYVIDNVIAYSGDSSGSGFSPGLYWSGSHPINAGSCDIERALPTIPLTEDKTIEKLTCCFLRGTLVTLADRTEKPIEDVTYDDELLVWDFDNGCYASAKPAWIKRREESMYYFRNSYASGRELLTTGRSETGWGHRHYDMTRNEFRYTPTTVGDTVFTLDGADEHVSCEKVAGACEFYNIITERHFNLFANGILTSCSLNNFRRIEGMRFVEEGGVIPFSVFRGFVDADEATARRYFDALRIGEMKVDGVSKIGEYVTKLITKEAK